MKTLGLILMVVVTASTLTMEVYADRNVTSPDSPKNTRAKIALPETAPKSPTTVMPRTDTKVPTGAGETARKPDASLKGPSSDSLMKRFMELNTLDPDATPPGEVDPTPQVVTLPWEELIKYWTFFQTSFSLHLNNGGNGASYNNNSYVEIDGNRRTLALPLVQYTKNSLHHRCLIRNMDAPAGMGITLTREGCGFNQLRVIVPFESGGDEIKRFNKSLSVLQKNWCDGCEADRHLNHATLDILLTFTNDSSSLDCSISAKFEGEVTTPFP